MQRGKLQDADTIPTLYRPSASSKILGTLVYLVRHERIAPILDEHEHVASIDTITHYKKVMGGDWKKFEGTINVYQLDGIDGHRFVISFYWNKKWHRKLKKVLGIKISCVERLDLLEKLCNIEEYRKVQNANSFDVSIHQSPISTIKVHKNKMISVIPEEESWEESPTLATNKESKSEKPSNKVEETPAVSRSPTPEVKSAPLTGAEDFMSETESTKSGNMSPKLSQKTIPNGNIPSGEAKDKNDARKLTNGTILEVEVHNLPEVETETDQSDKENTRSSTIEEDLNGYSETMDNVSGTCYNALPSGPETLIHANKKDKDITVITEEVHDPGEPGSSKYFDSSKFVDIWWGNSPTYGRESNRQFNRRSQSEEGRSLSKPKMSFLAKVIGRFKPKLKRKSKDYRIEFDDNFTISRNASRSALFETGSLRSFKSNDAISIGSLNPNATLLCPRPENYDRKYFRGRPASLHVLKRDRKVIPVYDVINCILEFHNITKPVKIIGINSTKPEADDLAEHVITEIVDFFQKPSNVQLRSTRRDYVLHRSVIKMRSFADSELRLLLGN